jgi:hypothetical protein
MKEQAKAAAAETAKSGYSKSKVLLHKKSWTPVELKYRGYAGVYFSGPSKKEAGVGNLSAYSIRHPRAREVACALLHAYTTHFGVR